MSDLARPLQRVSCNRRTEVMDDKTALRSSSNRRGFVDEVIARCAYHTKQHDLGAYELCTLTSRSRQRISMHAYARASCTLLALAPNPAQAWVTQLHAHGQGRLEGGI